MAWTAPMTAVAGNAFTAAQFNSNVRDNLLETAPGKATTVNGYFVTTAANSIAERVPQYAEVITPESRNNTTYGDLTTVGPAITVTTGTKALVIITAQMQNSSTDGVAAATVAVSGATTVGSSDDNAIILKMAGTANIPTTCTRAKIYTLTAGSNTFTMKYRHITNPSATFERRALTVIPF